MKDWKQVTVYTDGACRGNPGRGGYGVVLKYGRHRKELSAGFRRTTNNRMELLAAVVALESLKEPCAVTLYSDSRYLVNAVTRHWLQFWQRNGWKKADKQPVVNVDLWQRYLAAAAPHRLELLWLKGHAGQLENTRCDQLATRAADGGEWNEDDGFSG
ncbi:ribonuclease HI [Victivallis sp. Marseille-Q1083]|uniref:ribonuclease HI n=1 Tax=Victivallis sp. Marseille-Q1083 TaxID=2717288 RepID=UPI001588EE1B|nr:ribonuclease HI [Victivallis sp. Marseille-Q1083]